MAPIEILFFDVPIPPGIPGFVPFYPTAFFPCLGTFRFIDCAIGNTRFADRKNRHLFIQKEHMKQQRFFSLGEDKTSAAFTALTEGTEREKTILDFLESRKGQPVILYNLSSVCLLDSDMLLEKASGCGKEMIRLSVDYSPSDIYIAPAEYFLALLKKNTKFMDTIFSEILPSNSDLLEEVEGKVLLFSTISTFQTVHLEMIHWKNFDKYLKNLLKLSMLVKQEDTFISETGEVKNSLIFSGAKVEGNVVNSFIYPGVHIGESARISNSVIMTGHKIGKNVSISNSLLFPYFDEILTGSTVGSESVLGSDASKASNRSFPKQINQGLTVIGTNVRIPRKMMVEPGCYIGPNTDESSFSGKNKINKGTTLKPVGDKSA